jgi:acyl-CoA synthetase (AMP-forming)/AMP-acid ligase II
MFRRLLFEGDDARDKLKLRWVIVGGEAVPASLVESAAARGIEVLQDYGSTEAGPVTIMSSEDAVSKAGSCGKPHFHTEVRVIDDRGADVGPDEVGEIIVRARHIMKGYWNRPHSTSEVLRDGWFYTGDLATIDSDGFLYIKDRKRDMIISGGENIYPAEVERVLMSHPQVKEVAVIGQRSEQWGESPVAIVVLKDGTDMSPECLISFCRGKIAGYKIPRNVEFVSELPRTVTGKVQKNVLRERFPGPFPHD